MEIVCGLHIDSRPKGRNSVSTAAHVTDTEIYSKLLQFAEWYKQYPNHWSETLSLKLPLESIDLTTALDLLKASGWTPHFGEFLPIELSDNHFEVRRFRQYDKKDYLQAEYFMIHRWSDMTLVFNYVGMKDGLVVGQAAKAKWKTRYGLTQKPRPPRFVNGELKHDLEQAQLSGLTFLPVLFDHPEKAEGEFWQISSTMNMPRCRLPLIDIPVGDGRFFREYDDGGHFPQELVFKRSEVAAIEPFDVALTAPDEELHRGPDSWPYTLIVSARCRKVMLTQCRLSTVEFVPVKLI